MPTPTTTAAPSSLTGTAPQAGLGAYGQVPTVPSPAGTQGQAISGNMGNLGSLYGLTGSLNTNIAQQAALPYQLNLPNYGAMTGQSSNNILSLLRGQVPQDVANQIQQMAAQRGIATGSPGSPNSNAALLGALGLTSLGLQQQGEGEFTGAMQRTPTGQQFNPQSFLFTPQQQQEASYAASVLGAAPNPEAAAQAGLNSAQQGLFAGANSGIRAGGGSGQTDALGFPLTPATGENFGSGGAVQAPFGTTAGSQFTLPMPGAAGSPFSPSTDWQTGMQLPGYQGYDMTQNPLFPEQAGTDTGAQQFQAGMPYTGSNDFFSNFDTSLFGGGGGDLFAGG